jgi:hypothetical protein
MATLTPLYSPFSIDEKLHQLMRTLLAVAPKDRIVLADAISGQSFPLFDDELFAPNRGNADAISAEEDEEAILSAIQSSMMRRPSVDERDDIDDDLVDLALQYGSIGTAFNYGIPREVIRTEIVGVCVVDSPDYTGSTPDFNWMCTCKYEE